jgi:hypothetical protein
MITIFRIGNGRRSIAGRERDGSFPGFCTLVNKTKKWLIINLPSGRGGGKNGQKNELTSPIIGHDNGVVHKTKERKRRWRWTLGMF